MNVSIASYSFHGLLQAGAIDLFGYLEACRFRYHLNTADIWNGMMPGTDKDFLVLMKKALKERDLELVNLCVDGPHLWEDDADLRKKHHADGLAYLNAAAFLGANTIRIDAGGKGDIFTEEQFDYIVDRYKEYAQIAYDGGFKVGPENHWGPEVVPENMVRICQAVNHPGFGVLLHFRGNSGDKLIAPWTMHTHISWDTTESCLKESLELLRLNGYQGCLGVEHHSSQDEYLKVAIQFAKVKAEAAQL